MFTWNCCAGGYKVTVGKNGDKEIDFVCVQRGEKLYVQAAYLLVDESTVQREFGVYDFIRRMVINLKRIQIYRK